MRCGLVDNPAGWLLLPSDPRFDSGNCLLKVDGMVDLA